VRTYRMKRHLVIIVALAAAAVLIGGPMAEAAPAVAQSPVITSANHHVFYEDFAGTFTVTTSGGNPSPPALSETGALPPGLTFHDNGNGTATLSGTPGDNSNYTYTITIRADNGVAPVTTQSFTITVKAIAAA
jgi:hypothetical protein